jgi:acyl-CoA thioester hydrolase
MNALPLPTSGVLEGTTHLLPVRVYYEDTDAGGIVYHANYLRFAERARTDMLRIAGIDLAQLHKEQDLMFVVYRGEIDFKRPARFNDQLLVASDIVEIGHASAVINQVIWLLDARGARDTESAIFKAHVACVQSSGKPARFPKDLRARMESLIRQHQSTRTG